MRNRRVTLAIVVLMLVALAARHPSADIRLMMHDATDRTPHRMQAALDLGGMAFSVLITWTGKRLIAGR
ncbi:MAG: hypothetical protein B7Y45_07590 [Sphingomonas sp. 28-66-16]|nr:MAG: hypothetical protein B7Y45_07590 [Sphingomonas sp. 28-66-16]